MIKKIIITLIGIVAFTSAQANPQSEPITIVVPVAIGSAADTLGRLLAQELTRQGTPAIVVNKPGADKAIGVNLVATAAPDGKTLVVGSGGDVSLLPLWGEPNLRFNEHTMVPVAYLASTTPVLTANPNFPANNLKELLELIKKDPGKYPIGSFGKSPELQALDLFKIVGATPTIVNYKGPVPMATDTIGGSLPLGIQPYPTVKELIKNKKLKIIASFGEKRGKEFPNVGTVSEINGSHMTYWWAIFAPPGTPTPIAKQLNHSINEAMKSKAIVAQLSDLSYNQQIMSLDQFDAFYAYQVSNQRKQLNQLKSKKGN